MKFVLSYRTELFMIFLVPILEIRWYRFIRYSGTGLSAMMVPFHAIRRYRLTDTITTSTQMEVETSGMCTDKTKEWIW